MLFLITQTHTPEQCTKNAGGVKALYNDKAEGVTLKALYGAFSDHIVYYVVEANSLKAINDFLTPGWTRCTSRITPVSDEPVI